MAGNTKAGKIMSDKKTKTTDPIFSAFKGPFKVHYGHHTLGRTSCGLCITRERGLWLTMNRRHITCEKCHRAQG